MDLKALSSATNYEPFYGKHTANKLSNYKGKTTHERSFDVKDQQLSLNTINKISSQSITCSS